MSMFRDSRRFRILIALISVALASGCGGRNNSSTKNPQVGQMYVALNTFSKIERFHMSDSGDPTPLAIIQASNTVSPRKIAADVTHDRLYVCDILNADITVFDSISTRSGGPADRQVIGTNTTLTVPDTPAIDPTRDLFYVTDHGRVLVFTSASTMSGNVAPARIITPAFSAGGIALDANNDRLFVTDLTNNGIAVFDHASTVNGAAVPDREITSTTGPLSQPGEMALDGSGHLLVTASNGPNSPPRLYVFANAGAANGNTAPSALSILADAPEQMVVSPTGDLYTATGANVSVYSGIAGANGPISPIRTIQGPNSGIATMFGLPPEPLGIAVDPSR